MMGMLDKTFGLRAPLLTASSPQPFVEVVVIVTTLAVSVVTLVRTLCWDRHHCH